MVPGSGTRAQQTATESLTSSDSAFVPYDMLWLNRFDAQRSNGKAHVESFRIARHLDGEGALPLYRPLLARTLVRCILISTRRYSLMSRRCEITGVGPMVGNNVSHSNIKTKRRFMPNLAAVKLQSDALGQAFSLRITNAALRTVDFRGGLDVVLLKAKDEVLSTKALKIKRALKAKIAEQAAA